MIDPSMALYHKAVSLNQVAEVAQRRFAEAGYHWAGHGPVATRIGEQMRTALILDEIAGCGHPSVPAVWLPTAPELLRCVDCYGVAWLEARERCAGCEQSITTGDALVGLVEAQVLRNAVILGPWLVVYPLCVDCQREDGAS